MKRLFPLMFLLFVLSLTAFAQNQQTVSKLSISSAVLGEERVVLVRTPAGYDGNKQQYPVLYMTDGLAQLNHTIATTDFLARNGRMSDLIIVAITNTDRTRDLTPTKATLANPGGQPTEFPTAGGADRFLKFIETELIPKIESEYRVQPYRIFAGHSFGGLFALHAFLTRPEVFNAFIAVSPTMEWDNHLLSRKAETFFKERKELNRTLYLTLANEGGETKVGFERFKALLSKHSPKGFSWGAALMEDEDHGSVVLRSHYEGLRKVFEGWQLGGNVASLDQVETHYKKLSAKFNYTILPPEAMMNQFGYQMMAWGKMDEAVAIFKTNVKNYPQSANVYDSLAECYEKNGKLDLAKPNYEKAVQVGTQTNDPNLQVFKTNFDRVNGVLKKTAEAKGNQ